MTQRNPTNRINLRACPPMLTRRAVPAQWHMRAPALRTKKIAKKKRCATFESKIVESNESAALLSSDDVNVNIGARRPNLGGLLAVPAESQHIVPRRQLRRHHDTVNNRHVSGIPGA